MASSHYNMACYKSQAADGKRFNRPRLTWGKNHHCGVVHFSPATFKALGFFKVLHSLSFLWKITKPGHNFLETEYFVTNPPFFFKLIKGFFFGGGGDFFPTFYLENMISTYTKDFSWKKYLNSLDFEEKIISYCQIFMTSPVGSR